MSGRHPAWTVLGIEPTSDARAIRAAYSAKLKAIDPEADPKAFIALRDAFEAARSLPVEEVGEASPYVDTAMPVYQPVASGPEWSGPENPTDEPVDAVAAHADAIALILYNHDPGADWLDEATNAELLAHWQAIAGDPRLDDVTLFDRVEQWAAGTIIDTAPRSAQLMVPMADYFGWPTREGTLAESPAIAAILRYYHAIRFLHAAKEPGHSHNAAWVELNTPASPGARRGTVGPRLLFDLIDLMRWVRPDLIARLDPARVSLWERKAAFEASDGTEEQASGYSRPAWIGGGFVVIYILLAAMRSCQPEQEERRPPPDRIYYEAEPARVLPPLHVEPNATPTAFPLSIPPPPSVSASPSPRGGPQ